MILKLLVPPQESYEVDGTNGYQLVVCLVEDDGNEYVCALDQARGTYHVQQIIDTKAIFKFSCHNMKRIDDDEEWEAVHKFMYEKGLGIIIDGMRQRETGSLIL